MNGLPSYQELLERTDAPAGSAWGVFGPDDDLGTVNFLTPERVLNAARCIRQGKTFNLDCPVNIFAIGRSKASHVIETPMANVLDDHLDGFNLQQTSQIDGLRHMRHIKGYYNDLPAARMIAGDPLLGVNRWADHGMVGRGVLLDVASYQATQGKPIKPNTSHPITVEDLKNVAQYQGVAIESGDILMIRTGWLDYYVNHATAQELAAMPGEMSTPGLVQSHETLGWLWDKQIAVCAADNPGVEVFPPAHPPTPFWDEDDDPEEAERTGHRGLMHARLIAFLGLVLGELWDLETLSKDCAADGIYECFVTIKPMNLIGGVASTPNATAIK